MQSFFLVLRIEILGQGRDRYVDESSGSEEETFRNGNIT
jgi:hypothetical protein